MVYGQRYCIPRNTPNFEHVARMVAQQLNVHDVEVMIGPADENNCLPHDLRVMADAILASLTSSAPSSPTVAPSYAAPAVAPSYAAPAVAPSYAAPAVAPSSPGSVVMLPPGFVEEVRAAVAKAAEASQQLEGQRLALGWAQLEVERQKLDLEERKFALANSKFSNWGKVPQAESANGQQAAPQAP